MKSLLFTGLIFLAIATILFYFIFNFSFDQLFDFNFLIGILSGLGFGQVIGGIIGYISKGSSVKEAQRRKEIERLQKEKQELEKQASLNTNSNIHQNPSV